MKRFLLLTSCSLLFMQTYATTWYVGPTRTYTFCSQIASLVQHGDSILIDPTTYVNDPQVIWNKNNLYIAGNGGRPRLEAGSIIANDMVNGKGIFVISGSGVHVHNMEFAKAAVQDNNGAGIRQEGANLWVTNCLFIENEMGILSGNIPNCKTIIEYCEFLNGGSVLNPGYQHNIYINHIDTLVFRYNYSHDAIAEGHELKSRATYNFILYNRIANEESEDSRTIDLPNGGTCVIVGNVIEQGLNSANSNLVGYGLEGLTNEASHSLYCCNNTFINKKSTGSFIQVANGTELLFVKNNLFAGVKTGGLIIGAPALLDSSNNLINNSLSVFGFEDEASFDYHLLPDASGVDKGIQIPDVVFGYALMPTLEYEDQTSFVTRFIDESLDLGAYEFASPVSTKTISSIEIKAYPNPANEFLFVDIHSTTDKIGDLQLLNLLGETVLHQKLQSGINKVDVSMLIGNIYFAMIPIGNELTIRKIGIQ